jgi:hypothetical protein
MGILKTAPPPPTKPSLSERIEALHAEIEALLDATVEKARAGNASMLHPGVVRMTIVRGRCLCAVGRELEKQP